MGREANSKCEPGSLPRVREPHYVCRSRSAAVVFSSAKIHCNGRKEQIYNVGQHFCWRPLPCDASRFLGSALDLVVSYGVLIPLKLHGILPVEMTYVRVTFGPTLVVVTVMAYLLVIVRFPKKAVLCCWAVTIGATLASIAIALLDSGL